VIGKFKCETKGAAIIEFIGLRPKMYSYLYKESDAPDAATKEKHRVKGISRAAARTLKHEEYRRQLEAPTENYVTTRRIGSKLHQLYSIANEKRALCAYDDKRFILADNHHTLAYGHKDIPITLEVDEIQNIGHETIMTEDEAREVHFPMGRPTSDRDEPLCLQMHPDSNEYPRAREMGLLWTQRNQAKKHLEQLNEKLQMEPTDEQELEAGREIRTRAKDRLTQVETVVDHVLEPDEMIAMWAKTPESPVMKDLDGYALDADEDNDEQLNPFIEMEATEKSEDDKVDEDMADWPSDDDLNYEDGAPQKKARE